MLSIQMFMQHACVVRCFALEEDEEFVYLALERCQQTLAQMLTATPTAQSQFVDDQGLATAYCMQVNAFLPTGTSVTSADACVPMHWRMIHYQQTCPDTHHHTPAPAKNVLCLPSTYHSTSNKCALTPVNIPQQQHQKQPRCD